MSRFFPDAQHVAAARVFLSSGRLGNLPHLMGTALLPRPDIDDLEQLLAEFSELADELELTCGTESFMILMPVRVDGTVLTTPVVLDLERRELGFTCHPALGAGTLPASVLAENPELPAVTREELLGILATWRNPPVRQTVA